MTAANRDKDERQSPSVEGSVFWPSVLVAVVFTASFLISPEGTGAAAQAFMKAISTNFGWLYMIFGIAALGYCLWLAFGKYAHIKLGEEGEAPEFSTMYWVAMMFTAGIGAGTVAWAFAEPIYYLQAPPFGIDPFSSEAYEWAHMVPLVHWGLIPWAFYTLPAVPIAYTLYVRRRPYLRLSESCEDALPSAGRGVSKSVIDIFIILGIVGGTTTSLGVGVPLVSALLAELTGLENSIGVKLSVLVLWVLIFGTSTVRGLKRGIQILANFNMGLAGILLMIVLTVGPTVLILKMITNSLGLMADNFIRVALWMDPIEESGFPEDWTIFYWAWWIAFAAFVGLFIARISRGRTIRQLTLGTLLWGTLGTLTYISISGAYALHLELNAILPLSEILSDHDLYVMTAKIAANLPFGTISLMFFIVLCIVFYATTMDSAAYIAAGICSRKLNADQDPQIWLRVVWIVVMFLITVGLILTDSLRAVQAMTVIGSLPLLPILIIMSVALVRRLKIDHG